MSLEKLLDTLLVICCLLAVLFAGYICVGCVRSNGAIDYCYVEMLSPNAMIPQFQLRGHRPWRVDRQIGVYLTLEEAKQKADLMSCKLNAN